MFDSIIDKLKHSCLSGEEQDASATTVQEHPSPDKGRTGGVSSAELSFTDHVNAAAKLIEETGYHRRDKELAELQKHISSTMT